jgi:hypothetical protein
MQHAPGQQRLEQQAQHQPGGHVPKPSHIPVGSSRASAGQAHSTCAASNTPSTPTLQASHRPRTRASPGPVRHARRNAAPGPHQVVPHPHHRVQPHPRLAPPAVHCERGQQGDDGGGGSCHQSSMPRWAGTPALNACLTLVISVTVSASSMISGGQRRPVRHTCTWAGRRAGVQHVVQRQPAVDQRVGDLVQHHQEMLARQDGGAGLSASRRAPAGPNAPGPGSSS